VNVALIEDDPAQLAALAVELDVPGRATVTGVYADAESALRSLPRAWPDVVLVDLSLPGIDGATLIARLRALAPHVVCVVHSSHDEPARIFGALQAGAVGYLLKDASGPDLLLALEEAVAGGAPLARSVARQLLAHVAGSSATAPEFVPRPPEHLLSVRVGAGALRFVTPAEKSASAAAPEPADGALGSLATDDRVFLKNDRGARFVPLADLAAIVSCDNYTDVFVADGSHFLVRRSLKAWEAALPAELFLRVHRQALVNFVQIERIADPDGDAPELMLRGMKQPVSCSYRFSPELRRRLVKS
jgi:DNA-binding NarL/FixJ family response regulator